MTQDTKKPVYDAGSITVLEGLEAVHPEKRRRAEIAMTTQMQAVV